MRAGQRAAAAAARKTERQDAEEAQAAHGPRLTFFFLSMPRSRSSTSSPTCAKATSRGQKRPTLHLSSRHSRAHSRPRRSVLRAARARSYIRSTCRPAIVRVDDTACMRQTQPSGAPLLVQACICIDSVHGRSQRSHAAAPATRSTLSTSSSDAMLLWFPRTHNSSGPGICKSCAGWQFAHSGWMGRRDGRRGMMS